MRFFSGIHDRRTVYNGKNLQYNFPKTRGGGAKAIWNFSEKTSVLVFPIVPYTGVGSFDLEHSGAYACGIPDGGDTIVLTGGYPAHKYVTRWVDHHHPHHVNNDSDDDHDFDNDNENEYFSIND